MKSSLDFNVGKARKLFDGTALKFGDADQIAAVQLLAMLQQATELNYGSTNFGREYDFEEYLTAKNLREIIGNLERRRQRALAI